MQHHQIYLFPIGLITACAMDQLHRGHQLHPGPACSEHEQCGTCGGHSFCLNYTERSLQPEPRHSLHCCGQSIPLLQCCVFGYKNSEDRSVKSMCVFVRDGQKISNHNIFLWAAWWHRHTKFRQNLILAQFTWTKKHYILFKTEKIKNKNS